MSQDSSSPGLFSWSGVHPPRRIELQTRRGRDITNDQPDYISDFVLRQIRTVENDHPNAKRRTEPSPFYNCHGMVFASRRTNVSESGEIEKILEDDRSDEVVDPSTVMCGDVLIYYKDGDPEHSAVVVAPPTQQTLFVPLVVSKWGSGGEYVHRANDCEYSFATARYYRVKRQWKRD